VGTVTEIHYLLPHSWVYIEVKDAKGAEPAIWALEATGPQGIFRNGVGKDDVKVGDKVLYGKYSGTEVTVEGEQLLILRESDVLAVLT